MRNYHFMSRYPDMNYKEKVKRIAKTWAWGLAIITLAIMVWVGLGAPVSYGGGLKKHIKGKLGSIATCVKNSDALTWRPTTDPAFISHYLVFASQRPKQLKSASRLQGIKPFGSTKDTTISIPKRYRKRLYFYTVQAVSFGGLKSKPAKPISCLQKGQGE